MGVHFQSVILFGWEIGVEQFRSYGDEKYDAISGNELYDKYNLRENNNEGDVVVVYDGRSGEYAYVGVLIGLTNSTRNGEQNFDTRYQLDGCSEERIEELREIIKEYDIDVDSDPSYHVFTMVL